MTHIVHIPFKGYESVDHRELGPPMGPSNYRILRGIRTHDLAPRQQ